MRGIIEYLDMKIKYCSSDAIIKNKTGNGRCCAGSMTGYGVKIGFVKLEPFKVYGNKFLYPPIYGQIVPENKVNQIMFDAGFLVEYRQPRESKLYPTRNMRRSWRKKGISQEIFLSYMDKVKFGSKIRFTDNERTKEKEIEIKIKLGILRA